MQVPALVLWGAEDNTVPLRDAGIVADEWPEADLRIMPKAGHWPHFERDDATRRQVAAYLGLPRFSDELNVSIEDGEWARTRDTAQFLAHSMLGDELNLAQRMRLAAQCRQLDLTPRSVLVHTNEVGDELFIVQSGTIEVWSSSGGGDQPGEPAQLLATFGPGKMVGEFALLDQGRRSADLIAGLDGAVVLGLSRNRLLALCEDDAVLGSRLLWNFARAVGRRARLINEQRQRILTKRDVDPRATRPLLSPEPEPVPQRKLDLEPVR
jgi:CRP-like cAMP-binding protein